MANALDKFISDGNTILKLNNKYSEKTVKGKTISTNNIEENITIVELGEDYIQIPELPLNYTILIDYNILGTLPTDNKIEYDLIERIVRLEKGMEDMYEIIKAQKEALNNRVNITAFKAWTNLIEKKTGIKLVEGNLNHINRELYK